MCVYVCTFTIREWFSPVPPCIRWMLGKTWIRIVSNVINVRNIMIEEKTITGFIYSIYVCVCFYASNEMFNMFWFDLCCLESKFRYLMGKPPIYWPTEKASKSRSKPIPNRIEWLCIDSQITKICLDVFFLSMGIELCVSVYKTALS